MPEKSVPISPRDVARSKAEIFPNEVIESFNELIAQKFTGGSVTIKQGDVVALMVKKGLSKEDIFNKEYLNIEEIYRSAGWKVMYDKPAYDESYEAEFTFTPKKQSN